jgi:hypothetical protein
MPSALIQFRANDYFLKELDARAGVRRGEGRGSVASRDLGRFYTLLGDELFRLYFTEAEAKLLLCGRVKPENPRSYNLLWATLDDAVRDQQLDQHPALDAAAFVERIRDLSRGQTMALVDLLERYDNLPPEERAEPVEALKRLGLHIR